MIGKFTEGMKIEIKTGIYLGQAAKIVSHVIWKITVIGTVKTGESIASKLILTFWKVTNVFVYVSVTVC